MADRNGRVSESTPHRLNPYIASRGFDTVFFILSPLAALAVAVGLTPLEWAFERTRALGGVDSRISIFIGVMTTAHLFAVLFRSHANPEIFARHRLRFVAVPIALFAMLVSSPWLMVTGFVVAAIWDVYHSSLQNFGLCRIWDARLGNDPVQGRSLDIWLAHTLYIAPILAGPSLHKTLETVEKYSQLDWYAPIGLLHGIDQYQWPMAWAVVLASLGYGIYYIVAYRRLIRSGYRVSSQKIAFLLSVGSTSVLAWGFLPPLQAFFVANLFHNIQYFGIVWWAENRNIRRIFGVSRFRLGQPIALAAYVASLSLLALACETGTRSNLHWALAAGLVVTLMHFWYDGFIWSVRRKDTAAPA